MQTLERARRSASEYAELMLRQFDLIGAMQREVLEFARGEKSVLVRKVYLQKFFDDVREQLEGELGRRGVELVVDVQERGTARFDEGKMLRVVHNLARNAAEAMGTKGGKFVIKVTRDKDDGALVVGVLRHRAGHPQGDRAPPLPVVRDERQEGRHRASAWPSSRRSPRSTAGRSPSRSSSRGATFKLRLPQP